MFGFIRKVFIAAMTFFNLNLLSVSSLDCVSRVQSNTKNDRC